MGWFKTDRPLKWVGWAAVVGDFGKTTWLVKIAGYPADDLLVHLLEMETIFMDTRIGEKATTSLCSYKEVYLRLNLIGKQTRFLPRDTSSSIKD